MFAGIVHLDGITPDGGGKSQVEKQADAVDCEKSTERKKRHQEAQKHPPAEKTESMTYPENQESGPNEIQPCIAQGFNELLKVNLPE
jgi:hypothetical protein